MLISGIQQFTAIDYPEKLSCIVWTAGCNFRCGYCHNPEFVLPEKLQEIKESFIPEQAVMNFLDSRKGKLDGVVMSGGEPTLQHDLYDFIKKIKAKDFLVKLDTNGTKPDLVEGLLEEGLVDYVAMDYKVPLSEYGIVSGAFKYFPNIARTRDILLQGGRPYEFRATILRQVHTPERLRIMAEELAGAENVFLQEFRPGHTLDPAYQQYEPFTDKEMEQIKNMFQEHVKQVTVRK